MNLQLCSIFYITINSYISKNYENDTLEKSKVLLDNSLRNMGKRDCYTLKLSDFLHGLNNYSVN